MLSDNHTSAVDLETGEITEETENVISRISASATEYDTYVVESENYETKIIPVTNLKSEIYSNFVLDADNPFFNGDYSNEEMCDYRICFWGRVSEFDSLIIGKGEDAYLKLGGYYRCI